MSSWFPSNSEASVSELFENREYIIIYMEWIKEIVKTPSYDKFKSVNDSFCEYKSMSIPINQYLNWYWDMNCVKKIVIKITSTVFEHIHS